MRPPSAAAAAAAAQIFLATLTFREAYPVGSTDFHKSLQLYRSGGWVGGQGESAGQVPAAVPPCQPVQACKHLHALCALKWAGAFPRLSGTARVCLPAARAAAASVSLLVCGSVYLLGAVTCIGVIKSGGSACAAPRAASVLHATGSASRLHFLGCVVSLPTLPPCSLPSPCPPLRSLLRSQAEAGAGGAASRG